MLFQVNIAVMTCKQSNNIFTVTTPAMMLLFTCASSLFSVLCVCMCVCLASPLPGTGRSAHLFLIQSHQHKHENLGLPAQCLMSLCNLVLCCISCSSQLLTPVFCVQITSAMSEFHLQMTNMTPLDTFPATCQTLAPNNSQLNIFYRTIMKSIQI